MPILQDLCCRRLGWCQSCRICVVGGSDDANPTGFVLSEAFLLLLFAESHPLQPRLHAVGIAGHVYACVVALRLADVVRVEVFGQRGRQVFRVGGAR